VEHPVVILTGRHRPHQAFLLLVSVVTGVAYTVGAPPPASVTALLPHWAVLVWAGGLVVSGIVGLIGTFGRGGWALQVEQASMLLGAGALMWYTAAVVQFGWRGLFAASITIAWACANLARAAQIRRDLRHVR
jgi:hypothetical protein